MLAAYVPRGNVLERRAIATDGEVPEDAVWIDLLNPASREDKLIERRLGIAVPTARDAGNRGFEPALPSSITRASMTDG